MCIVFLYLILITSQALAQVSSAPLPSAANDTVSGEDGDGDLGVCFAQWESFWSASASKLTTTTSAIGSTRWVSVGKSIYSTFFPAIYPTTSTSRTVESETISEYAGGHSIGLTTSTWTYANTYTYSSYVPASSRMITYNLSSAITPSSSTTITKGPSLVAPACQLPSVVPQCQSQWVAFESGNATKPVCPLASIGGELCNTLRDRYIDGWIQAYEQNPYIQPYLWSGAGSVATFITQPDGSVHMTSTFPTASSLAPGCSLGCARCAITGGRVRLLYWPVPQTSASNVTGSAVTTFEAVNPTELVTVPFSGTTLTSPTVYISYKSLYASDSCSAVGANHSATIIALPEPTLLSSFYFTWNDGGQIAQTSSFDYADLNSPIPSNVFTKQPACYWTGCPTTVTAYEPILVVPLSIIRSIDPAWSTCSADILGLYDPPYTLHGAETVATPIASDPWPSITAASPAITPQAPTLKPSVPPIPPKPISSSSSSANDPSTKHPSTSDPSPSDPSASFQSQGGGESSNQDPPPNTQAGPKPSSSLSQPTGSPSAAQSSPESSADPAGGVVSIVLGGNPSSASVGNPPSGVDSGETTKFGGGSYIIDPTAHNSGSGSPESAPTNADGSPQGQSRHSAVPSPADNSGNPAQPSSTAAGIGAAILSGLGVGQQPPSPAATTPQPNTRQTTIPFISLSLSAASVRLSTDASGFTHTLLPIASTALFTDPAGITHTAVADPTNSQLAIIDGGYVTLSAGGSAATIDGGQIISLNGANGLAIEDREGQVMSTIALSAARIVTAGEGAVFTGANGIVHTAIAVSSGIAVVDGSTISSGGAAASVGGEIVSLGSAGLVVGSDGISGTVKTVATFSVGGQVHTAVEESGGVAVADGRVTMSVGGSAISVGGEVASMASGGMVVDGTKTVGFAAGTGSGPGAVTTGRSGNRTFASSTTGPQNLYVSGSSRERGSGVILWSLAIGTAFGLGWDIFASLSNFWGST
ncbi:MAG: hypothetical protein M1820_000714 [Bogoriella megaspora]|nr:MAG: hypothetical protein M1820_000714 [Bogoriella megaspora]